MLEQLPINIVDIGVLIVLFLGAVIGLALGFVRGGLFVASWLGAGLSTLYGLPTAQVFTRKYIVDKFFADLTAGVGLFLITLVILFLLSSLIGGWVRTSRLNALDRSLGMVAGLTTSICLLAGSLLAIECMLPDGKRPEIIQEAKSLAMIRICAGLLNDVLPDKYKNLCAEAVNDAVGQTKKVIEKGIYERLVRPDARNLRIGDRTGYDKKERINLESAIDRLNKNSQ